MKSPKQLEMEYPEVIKAAGQRDDAIVADEKYVDMIGHLQNLGYKVRRVNHFSPGIKFLSLEGGEKDV